MEQIKFSLSNITLTVTSKCLLTIECIVSNSPKAHGNIGVSNLRRYSVYFLTHPAKLWKTPPTFPTKQGIFIEFVANPIGKHMQSSTPRNSAIPISNSLWISTSPGTKDYRKKYLIIFNRSRVSYKRPPIRSAVKKEAEFRTEDPSNVCMLAHSTYA